MLFHFIRFFYEAAAGANGGAGGAGGANDNQQQNQNQQQQNNDANKGADTAALNEKIVALEKKLTELTANNQNNNQQQNNQQNNQQQQNADDKDAKVPAWAKKLVEQNEKLTNQLTVLQGERVTASRRTLLETELKAITGLPEDYLNEVIDNFNGRTFSDDAAFDTFKKGKVEAAKKLAQKESANAVSVFSAPITSAGGGGDKVSTAMSTYLKSKNPQPSKN